jgi:hypothetical protein
MPKRRHHSGICEQANCPLFGKIKDNGCFMRIAAQKRHEAVVACRRLLHNAGIATDDQWL